MCSPVIKGFLSHQEKKIVCYYGTWATYRSGNGKFDVGNINADLCTHLVYTFVGINSQGNVVSLDPYLDLPDNWGRDNFRIFNALKQTNTKLKTILAVGGWNEGSAKYSIMAASSALRKNFVSSAIKMIMTYGFDGLDIDWEYPNRRDSVNGKADIDNFTKLLKELRTEFDKYGLLLSAAVASTRDTASLSYDIPTIAQYLDLLGLMTYDMYGPWDTVTGHNSPLHKGEGDEHEIRENLNTVDVAVEYWLTQGFPPEKLVIGLPFYGHTFTLINPNVYSVRAPSYGPGISGPYTATNGNIGYNEFCSLLREQKWSIYQDSLAKVPYAVQNRNWVSYDDVDSLIAKAKYALSMNIAGVMIWSIETDDFHGICHNETFPLLRAVKRILSSSNSSGTTVGPVPTTPLLSSSTTSNPVTTQVPTTQHSSTPTTPKNDFTCKSAGMFPNPKDCGSFYVCIQNLDGSFFPNYFSCPANLYWDQEMMSCNYPYAVSCTV
ncbi:chitinase-3-like protein 1 [Zerene cesonia]|uniref:chitinase-3-like protein 1 n=1 Tax=Zerene cesonia TaxID=33412 RepID=UPI0018E4DF2F|nr:chitinase-3-like protein 1 [Zerene cesonia]